MVGGSGGVSSGSMVIVMVAVVRVVMVIEVYSKRNKNSWLALEQKSRRRKVELQFKQSRNFMYSHMYIKYHVYINH